MPPYTAPSLATLRTSVARDLRDEEMKTWSPQQIDDLINAGIGEINRIRPLESVLPVALVDGTSVYPVTFSTIFRVEARRSGGPTLVWSPIPESRGEVGVQDGWDLFGGVLTMPSTLTLVAATDEVRVWGYEDRQPVYFDDDFPSFIDHLDEDGVRAYARYIGAEMLLHDRLLFGQWQTQSNNSDVSPTQMLQTVGTFQSAWETTRNRLRRLRRAG